jgi:hypothetical protein
MALLTGLDLGGGAALDLGDTPIWEVPGVLGSFGDSALRWVRPLTGRLDSLEWRVLT